MLRFILALAAMLAAGFLAPAHAVMGSPQTCFPDGRCTICVEYENSGGGQRCVKCSRTADPRCRRLSLGGRDPRCRFRPNSPECRKGPPMFNPDGTRDTNGSRYR